MIKILVIEDETQIRDNIQEFLELEGFLVIMAENGQNGLKLAKEERPDLIICDVIMPQMNGYEVLAQLRQFSTTSTIPFIFLTSKFEKENLQQEMKLEADDYLTKPFTLEELLEAIDTRLDKLMELTKGYHLQLDYALSQVEKTPGKLNYLNYHDSLTDLPNQLLFQEQFSHLQQQANLQQLLLPILVMGCEQFKQINSTLGHVVGNSLLNAIAARLTEELIAITSEELTMITYLGNQQFILLGRPTSDAIMATNLAEKCLKILSRPFILNNHNIFIKPSIGIALYQGNREDFHTLLTHGEAAMKQAEKRGGNQYQYYNSQLTLHPPRKVILEASLYHALKRNELEVYYQPQVNLYTGQIIGVEALIRWHNSELGFLSPSEFIPIAETTGLIIPMGEWVLKTACQQILAWQKIGIAPLKIHVNLSLGQFLQPQLSERIIKIVQETGLPPHLLILELTESLMMQDIEFSRKTLRKIQEFGIKIAIDDFGTGYSSLNHSPKPPFDIIKIDQSFIHDITNHPGNMAITTAVMQLSRSLNLELIAEGIETEAELAFLRQHSCQHGQGYLFSKPLSAQRFEKLYIFLAKMSHHQSYPSYHLFDQDSYFS